MKLFIGIVMLLLVGQQVNSQPLSENTERRISGLIYRMTPEEKASILAGTGFETRPIERLGIPSLTMTDGPVGVRFGKSTAFPVSIAMAATWDTALIERLGAALGREAKAKGRYMLLGPCVNINRVPVGGRSFESFGEDPYVASRMAVSYIEGVQSEHVAATVKHYVANNQEYERESINEVIDERTLNEIYFPAFRAAIQEGGSRSIMSAYNKVNGLWCSENPPLLMEILKKKWEFNGFVVSDWGAVHSTVPTLNAGLDVEMPTGRYLNPKSIREALAKGEVTEGVIDEMIRRLLRVMIWTGLMDNPIRPDTTVVSSPAHREIARTVAAEGIVLLKNEGGILPLDREKVKTIAVIGPNAAVARTGGGGSSFVTAAHAVSPLEALRDRLGDKVAIRYAQGVHMEGGIEPIPPSAFRVESGGQEGLRGEYFNNQDLKGTPKVRRIDTQINFQWDDGSPAPGICVDHFSVRWSGVLVPPATGTYTLSIRTDDGARLYFENTLVIDDWKDHAAETHSITRNLVKGQEYAIRVEYYENGGGAIAQVGWNTGDKKMLTEAVSAAERSDVALVFVGTSDNIESEGFDRKTLDLPAGQGELVQAVVAANPRTVVVLTSGAPVTMDPWVGRIPALLQSWFAGSEIGNAITDILFGETNPSGKLPVTFPKKWEDNPAIASYPGKDGVTEYREGIFVGYRHYDKNNIAPLFPFGFGLSYTTFRYDSLEVSGEGHTVRVLFTLTNTGARDGAEVAQVYVHDRESSVPRPPNELKAFQRVFLRKGETRRVELELHDDAFAFYDVSTHAWQVEPGMFDVLVGGSSRDLPLRASIALR